MSDQDKTLPATPRRIEKARKEGQVARSRDLGHLAAFGVAVLALGGLAPTLARHLQDYLVRALRFDRTVIADPRVLTQQFAQAGWDIVVWAVPIGAVMALVGAAAAVGSGGWNFTMQAIAPKFSKFNPISGIGNLVSMQQLTQTLKACVLGSVLVAIGAFYLRAHWSEFMQAAAMPLPAAVAHVAQALHGGMVMLLVALGLFAMVDVPLVRFQLDKRLRMSHQEVKQEHKESEGNAEVKGQMKARMRQMAQRRMMAAVPQADLVVMNPSHYAVALRYDEATMAAPKVVAKGADLVAMRIRDLAGESKVPVLQAPPLARALYTHVELDHEVPSALFAAVAQVLAWVYQLKAAARGEGPDPADLPPLDVPPELDPHDPRAAAAAAAADRARRAHAGMNA